MYIFICFCGVDCGSALSTYAWYVRYVENFTHVHSAADQLLPPLVTCHHHENNSLQPVKALHVVLCIAYALVLLSSVFMFLSSHSFSLFDGVVIQLFFVVADDSARASTTSQSYRIVLWPG
jgi:hypothetical protein